MFQHLKNIETAFSHVRRFTLIIISGCLLMSLATVYWAHRFQQQAMDRIYILMEGKALRALSSDRRANAGVEAMDHVDTFHRLFFTLSPDGELIRKQVSKALYLADGSAKSSYDNLRENGYYNRVVSGNVSQYLETDSITVDTGASPMGFRYYGRQVITRPTSRVVRSLVTSGVLREVPRSERNPHGFLIEKWETLENRDLKIERR